MKRSLKIASKTVCFGAGKKVLNLGCGSLTLSLMAAEISPDTNFYAINVDKNILTIAERKLSIQLLKLHYFTTMAIHSLLAIANSIEWYQALYFIT